MMQVLALCLFAFYSATHARVHFMRIIKRPKACCAHWQLVAFHMTLERCVDFN